MRDFPAESGHLTCIDTPLSRVFVGDYEVWKIKKSVCFDGYDLRKLEARRLACEEDARLNHRLAPTVIRGVDPVCWGAFRVPIVHGAGPPGDWAVRMRRLFATDRADVRLGDGRLDDADVQIVANRLAEFHENAKLAAVDAEGEPNRLAQRIHERFREFPRKAGSAAPTALAEVERAQLEFIHKHADWIVDRARTGRIREGHGDLRLAKLYLEHSGIDGSTPRVSVIGCVDWSESLRFGDVASDIAQLIADFALAGRSDLAERLLSCYAGASGDFDLYHVADFYERERALAAARIWSLSAGEANANEAERERMAAISRRWLQLALSTQRKPLLPPVVVALGGMVASGKSTVARDIARKIGAPVVEADRTRDRLLGFTAARATQRTHEAQWSRSFAPGFDDEVYAELRKSAEIVLGSGRPIVLDAGFPQVRLREQARDLARRFGVPFLFVECHVPPDTARQRLSDRDDAGTSGWTEIYDAYAARWQPANELAADEHLLLDTSRSLAESVTKIESRLPVWPAGLLE